MGLLFRVHRSAQILLAYIEKLIQYEEKKGIL